MSRPKSIQQWGKVKRLLFCIKYSIQRIHKTGFENLYNWFSDLCYQFPHRNAQTIPSSVEEIFRMFVEEKQKNILSLLIAAQIRKYEK